MSIFVSSEQVKVQLASLRGAQGPTGPQGIQGPAGPRGADGVSPSVALTREADGVRISVTDAQGTRSEKIYDGGGGAAASGYYIPAVDSAGNLTWAASQSGMPGAEGANIRGPQGERGPAGESGKTPVKGTDYFTAADKQGIVMDVLAALPNASGVSF